MEAAVRRCRHILFYSGQAFIIFGIWSFVKVFLQIYLDPLDWSGMPIPEGISEELVILVYTILMVIFCLIDIPLRLYIGLSAMGEGKGKKKSIRYLVFAGVYMILTAYSYVWILTGEQDLLDWNMMLSIFLDITNALILVEIMICSWKLRKI